VTPTARSLKHARDRNWLVTVVERWNPHARVRHDAFGFLDILILDGQHGVLGVQATSGSNVAARQRKIQMVAATRDWLRAAARLEVWGWRKLRERGKRSREAPRWTLRRVAGTLAPTARLLEGSTAEHQTDEALTRLGYVRLDDGVLVTKIDWVDVDPDIDGAHDVT
jgi:hypothetical protein